ncbi:hypothetical protein MRX96_011107 [Rhipicephalus microplus]
MRSFGLVVAAILVVTVCSDFADSNRSTLKEIPYWRLRSYATQLALMSSKSYARRLTEIIKTESVFHCAGLVELRGNSFDRAKLPEKVFCRTAAAEFWLRATGPDMRHALLLIASLALLGTVAGHHRLGHDDDEYVYDYNKEMAVPRHEFVRYRWLAWNLLNRESAHGKTVFHLARIMTVKWMSDSAVHIRFSMYQSTCARQPRKPIDFAKCWHNRKKPLRICEMRVGVDKILTPRRLLEKKCW